MSDERWMYQRFMVDELIAHRRLDLTVQDERLSVVLKFKDFNALVRCLALIVPRCYRVQESFACPNLVCKPRAVEVRNRQEWTS
jgi:hypothetical protein